MVFIAKNQRFSKDVGIFSSLENLWFLGNLWHSWFIMLFISLLAFSHHLGYQSGYFLCLVSKSIQDGTGTVIIHTIFRQ